MKILLTGASGMLGSDCTRVLGSSHEVTGISIEDIDIRNVDAIVSLIKKLKPELVLHCAANTDVDGCERNPNPAFSINSLGTRNVALGCLEVNSAMAYVSTDYVFDGKKADPYIEWDDPSPINVYGKSKLFGERYLTSLLSRSYIIRSSWLFGEKGNSFVTKIQKAARENKGNLKVVDDQIGSPTFTLDLASKIAEIVEKELYGIYHVTNAGHCSWYDFAKKIIALLNLHKTEVIPINSSEYNTPTRRPANSVLRNYALELEGMPLLRPWQEALNDFLQRI